MNRQQDIDAFLLAAHRLAVSKLRDEPQKLAGAAAQLQRWRNRNGATRADTWRDEWDRLIQAGVDEIERQACADDEHGALLRSMSPLSVVLTQRERMALLRTARSVA
jgi:hypothetical protein